MVEELMWPAPANNVQMADGVDPATGELIPPPTNSTWGAPAGLLHPVSRGLDTLCQCVLVIASRFSPMSMLGAAGHVNLDELSIGRTH